MIEDEMVGWHHHLNGPDSQQTPGDNQTWHAAVNGSKRVGHKLVTEQQQCGLAVCVVS